MKTFDIRLGTVLLLSTSRTDFAWKLRFLTVDPGRLSIYSGHLVTSQNGSWSEQLFCHTLAWMSAKALYETNLVDCYVSSKVFTSYGFDDQLEGQIKTSGRQQR